MNQRMLDLAFAAMAMLSRCLDFLILIFLVVGTLLHLGLVAWYCQRNIDWSYVMAEAARLMSKQQLMIYWQSMKSQTSCVSMSSICKLFGRAVTTTIQLASIAFALLSGEYEIILRGEADAVTQTLLVTELEERNRHLRELLGQVNDTSEQLHIENHNLKVMNRTLQEEVVQLQGRVEDKDMQLEDLARTKKHVVDKVEKEKRQLEATIRILERSGQNRTSRIVELTVANRELTAEVGRFKEEETRRAATGQELLAQYRTERAEQTRPVTALTQKRAAPIGRNKDANTTANAMLAQRRYDNMTPSWYRD